MPLRRRTARAIKLPPAWLLWGRFVPEKTSKAAWSLLDKNFISVSIPGGSTDRFSIEEIVSKARRPIPIESLCDELSCGSSIRGAVFLGSVGDNIDEIASSHDGVQWWISDNGLNMAVRSTLGPRLSSFDQFAGAFVAKHWKNGGLSTEALSEIASALDREAFALRGELPSPASTAIND